MGGPKGHQRGRKTHRMDQLNSRGEHVEPQPEREHNDRGDPDEGRRAEARHEHPTGRMTERGHRAGPRGGWSR